MKYCVLIMDGAAGLPLADRGNRTSLELARTPNLDRLASTGTVALARMVPGGLEPDSAVACMSIFGYDPKLYYSGRAPIEAVSMDIPIRAGEVLFRCNLVTVSDGFMVSHSSGAIGTTEAHELFAALSEALGSQLVHIYPGVGYRSILRLTDARETASAICTPPHDIPGKPVADYLPRGEGSRILLDLMDRSRAVLSHHPVNRRRVARGDLPATNIWLFWGSGDIRPMPAFQKTYGRRAAVTSGVNLLRGLGRMAGMDLLEIPGVTDGLDNDYAAQARLALDALQRYDVVIVHVEAPDEAGHAGSAADKIAAIEQIDSAMVRQMLKRGRSDFRVLVTADHPTPVPVRTHTSDPVPCVLWGDGLGSNGVSRLTEAEAGRASLLIDPGYLVMRRLIGE